jgi:hypothetical protein
VTAQSPFPYLELSRMHQFHNGQRRSSFKMEPLPENLQKIPRRMSTKSGKWYEREKISPHELSLVCIRPTPGLLGHIIATLQNNDSRFLGTAGRKPFWSAKGIPMNVRLVRILAILGAMFAARAAMAQTSPLESTSRPSLLDLQTERDDSNRAPMHLSEATSSPLKPK